MRSLEGSSAVVLLVGRRSRRQRRVAIAVFKAFLPGVFIGVPFLSCLFTVLGLDELLEEDRLTVARARKIKRF